MDDFGLMENNQASGRGNTALHVAASNGRAEVVELLLAANAPLDVENKSGRGISSAVACLVEAQPFF